MTDMLAGNWQMAIPPLSWLHSSPVHTKLGTALPYELRVTYPYSRTTYSSLAKFRGPTRPSDPVLSDMSEKYTRNCRLQLPKPGCVISLTCVYFPSILQISSWNLIRSVLALCAGSLASFVQPCVAFPETRLRLSLFEIHISA